MIRNWFTLLCSLIILKSSRAEAPAIEFTQVYDDRGSFNALAIDDTLPRPRHILLAGTSTESFFQFYALRVDTLGDVEWTHRWGGTDRCEDVIRLTDSTAAFIGYTTENSTTDYKIMRATSAGSLQGNNDFGNSTHDERARCAWKKSASELFLAGSTALDDEDASDMSLISCTPAGQINWSRSYPPGAEAQAIIQRNDSSFWICGTSDDDTVDHEDFIIVHTDSLGNALNIYTYGGSRADVCRAATRISPNLTLLVGSTTSFSPDSTQTDIWILAINDNGDSLWSAVFGGSHNDNALAVRHVADYDSGAIIAGYMTLDTSDTHQAMLLKVSASGDSLWSVLLAEESEFRDVVYDSLYRYHVAGTIMTTEPRGLYLVTEPDPQSPGQHPPTAFSLLSPADSANVTGSPIIFDWEDATDPDAGDVVAYALFIDSDTLFDNGLILGPIQFSTYTWPNTLNDETRYWRVVAQDQHLNLRVCNENFWSFTRIQYDSTQAFDLVYPENNYILTTPGSDFRWEIAYDQDIYDTISYDLHFEVGDCTVVFESLADTFIHINFQNNPVILEGDTVTWYVVASSVFPPMQRQTPQWQFVNWTVVVERHPELAKEFRLDPAYPNPFNASATIGFELDRASEVQLDIVNIEGRHIKTLISETRAPGYYRVLWNASDAASGVYFARLTSDNRTLISKLVLLR